jgi:hypothetical protein
MHDSDSKTINWIIDFYRRFDFNPDNLKDSDQDEDKHKLYKKSKIYILINY